MATSAGSIPISATFNSASLERDVLSALNRIQGKSTLKLNAKGFTEPLGRISGLASEFQKSLEASNARVVAFGASAGIIYNIQKAFNALISSTLETEKALIGINVVLNASSSTLNKFGNELFNIAKLTGSSFGEVASAATEFSRQGLALEDTLKRTRDALILTRLSGLDVVSSTEALTSAVNSFAKEALTTTDVVNKLAAVDAKFAVSSRDLSEAIKRVGSSASEAGVSFDELLGIVTSVQQTTARGGAVIGNALKTIFTRIQRPEVINDLRDFGVAVQDVSGKALPVVQVLENLAGSFEKLNPVVKAQVGELVGGVFQINILKAALSDLSKENSIFASATRASTLALDDAIEKNKAYNESISSLINQTLVNFAQLGKNIGNVSIAPGIEKIIGVLNSALEDINEKDSQSVGAKIGTGLLKGITDFITGPGLIVGAAILGKLFKRFGGFTVDAAKNLLEINTVAQQQAAIQKGISQVLASNPALIGQILAGTKTRLQVEKEIKDILVEQSALAKQIADTSISSSRSLVGGGLSVSREGYVVRRKADGYIPNFNNEFSQEVFSARKLGAKGSVSAQLSQGTIDGKKFIKNSGEIEIVKAGRNGDSAVIPFYGGGMEKALGMIARGQSGSILNNRMSKGFVPNFAGGKFGISDFKAYLRSFPVGQKFLAEAKKAYNNPDPDKEDYLSKIEWYRDNPQLVSQLKQLIGDFNKQNNSNFEISILKKFEGQLARGAAQAAKSGLSSDVIENIRREKEINDLEVLKNPRVPPSINSAVLIARMESAKDFYKQYQDLEASQGLSVEDKKAKLKQINQNLGDQYEQYAINQLKTIGYPDIVSAESLGLFGNAATRGGQNQTSVDAVSLAKQAFFEMKGGDIKTAQINDKFKRVRTDPGNFELLFKAKFGQDWSQAASAEELSLGKIWQKDPSAFDELFKKRSGMSWANILVGSDYTQAAKSGNKFINLNPSKGGGAYVGMKETFGSLKETKTANAPEPIPLSDIPSFLSEESQRVIGKLGYPKNYKGHIPNFAKMMSSSIKGKGNISAVKIGKNNYEIEGIEVNKDFRNQGLGSELYKNIVEKIGTGNTIKSVLLPQQQALSDYASGKSVPAKAIFPQLSWAKIAKISKLLINRKEMAMSDFEKGIADHKYNADKLNSVLIELVNSHSSGFIPNFAFRNFEIADERQRMVLKLLNEDPSRSLQDIADNLNTVYPDRKQKITKNEVRQIVGKARRFFEQGKFKDINLSTGARDRLNNVKSDGFIPNFAYGDIIGRGQSGVVKEWMLSNLVEKDFFGGEFAMVPYKEDVFDEWLTSKLLSEDFKNKNSFFKAPGVFGSPERAAAKFRIVKERIKGSTIRSKINDEIFASSLYKKIGRTAESQIRSSNLPFNKIADIADNPTESNIIFNDKALDIFSKIASSSKLKEKISQENFDSKRLSQILTAVQKKGGSGYIVDTGEFKGIDVSKISLDNLLDQNSSTSKVYWKALETANLISFKKAYKNLKTQILSSGTAKSIIGKSGEAKRSISNKLDNILRNKFNTEPTQELSNWRRDLSRSGKNLKELNKQERFEKVQQLLDKVSISNNSKGYIPNFNNPLRESILREISAGYPASQVRVGFSKSLVTDFNPSGAGVYNAPEGSLPAAMQLAKKAGINPKTKGMRMASKGHIPNFAEFDSYDVTAIIGSLAFLGTQIKEVAKTIKENKENVKRVNDGLKTEVDSIKKSAKERVVAINDQLKKEKQASDATLKGYSDQRKAINQQLKDLKNKAMTLPFGLSPADQALEKALRSDKRKLPAGERKEKARIAAEEVAASEKRKKIAEETRDLIAEQRASAAAKLTPYARASQFVKSAGFGIGVAGAGVANIVGQFLPEQNVKGKAIASGLGDIASYAGTGAAVGGIPGAIGGALLGAASFFKKVKDADAETSLLNINKQLDALKDKSNSFSNASQTYANSLEQLQSALNDPKSRPETLIKFQTSIADALNQIPSEFRQKVLNAGSDITKVSDAIAQVAKELNQSQESLQAQADILSLVSKNKTLLGFGETVLNKKDQDIFNRLFTRNINRNELIKNFENPQNFSNFISGIQNQLVSTRTISRMTGNYNFQNQTFSEVNKQNLPQIKRELENRGLFSGEIANVFEEASKNTNVENINNLVEAIRKVGIEAFKSKEDAELFAATLKENTKINEKNAKTIKDLTDSFNNLNLQVSNQINIEKERSSTIRKINQIQTEGQISIQRAKFKGALEQAAPFITDQQKFQIQSELDLNEVINKQNSEVRGAVNEVLDSFTESLTRRTEELRSGIIPEILSPEKRTEDITRERRVFQQNLQELIPLIQKGFQNINQGGNVEQIRKELADVILTQVKFKPESAQLLVEELNKSFSSFQNKLAEIKAQGDIDLEIQKTQNRYQEKLVALNQNLAIAGGAGALNATGALGVSELFDRLSELTSELRQNAAIGTKAQRGSSTFKLLDILTNELQLGRISGGQAIGNDLFPLIATSVQGRAEQIRRSAGRARDLTNIELIRSTGAGIGAGSELEKQFNQLNNNALEIAFDQIASQLKLQNIGDYFDLLTQESIYLNRLTEEQNKLLAAQTPDLNKNFNDVITTQVGDKLNTLNNNLLTQFKNLTVTTRVTDLQKQTRSLLPGNLPVDQQQKLLERISNLSSISALPLISTEDKKLPQLDLFSGLAKEFSTADVKITAETIKSIKSLFDEIKILNAELLAPSSKVAGSTQDQKTSASISSLDFVKNALYPLAPRNYVQPLKSPYLTQLEEIQRKREEDLQNQRNEFLKRINDAKSAGNEDLARQLELELEYKDKVKKIELSLKQAEQQIEVFETSRLGDLMFRSEKGAIYESAIEANARQGRVDVGNILKEGTTYNQADFARDTGETLKMFVADFKSGIGSAFSEAIKGTKSLRQAFADLFESLLNKLTDRATGQLVDAAFGAVEKGARSYFGGSKGGLMTSSGFIRGYNSGGLVTGGSGVRDDIPTMMNGGEFVIRKSSVNKYGEGFLSQLNQGIIPKRAGGGSFSLGPLQNEFVYNDPERPTSGEFRVDPRLSAFALTDENNPQNKIRQERYDKLEQYLIERDDYNRGIQKALDDFKKKVNGIFTQGLITAGVQIGAAGLVEGVKAGASSIGSGGEGGYSDSQYSSFGVPAGYGTSGGIRRAAGGYIARFGGGGSNKDNIPALLMGGEYVMSQKAVRNYGTNFMNQLNNGSIPKFADGGLVPNSNGSITTSTRNSGQNYSDNEALQALLVAINSLNDTISKGNDVTQAESGGATSRQINGSDQSGGMSIVNNISVNVTGSETNASVETNTQNQNQNNQNQNNQLQNNAKLAEILKGKVLEVIVEQKRPGGLLASGRS